MNKKFLGLLVLTLALIALPVWAARTVTEATLNGGSSVKVKADTTVTTAVTVEITGLSFPWSSTRYRIGPGSWTCVDHGEHPSGTTAAETFLITSPSSAGSYDVDLDPRAGDSCTGASNTETLLNGVIVDIVPPVIDAHADVTEEATDASGAVITYTVPDAVDDVDGTFPATCAPIPGSAFPLGTTLITCDASDIAGNPAISTTFDIIVEDTTPPVITINGSTPIDLVIGDPYVDAGAVATDAVDVTDVVTTGGDTVDTSTIGTYVITYGAVDAAGNSATQVTRTVNVSDVGAPIVTLVGDNPQIITRDQLYVELGATALDDVDGDLTASIIIDASAVDTTTVGSYTVDYTVDDLSGNTGIASRTVTVQEPTPSPEPEPDSGSGSHSGGYVLGLGPNNLLAGGQVLGTSTGQVLGASTVRRGGLTDKERARLLRKRINRIRIKIYHLNNPQTPVVGGGTPTNTPTITDTIDTPDITSTGFGSTSTEPISKPWWKFW